MAMTQDQLKQQVAMAALEEVKPLLREGVVLGIGTGTTAERFIDALAPLARSFSGAVSSSQRSTQRLAACGVRVFDLNEVTGIPVYVDGADEVDPGLALLKGGGGALTREKIVASIAERFICIADASKLVKSLGAFPLPVEVIPMARAAVERGLRRLFGAAASLRLRLAADGQTFMTDNGNVIIDVGGLSLSEPVAAEGSINDLVGVVENGLFARRGADLLVVAGPEGVIKTKAGANLGHVRLS